MARLQRTTAHVDSGTSNNGRSRQGPVGWCVPTPGCPSGDDTEAHQREQGPETMRTILRPRMATTSANVNDCLEQLRFIVRKGQAMSSAEGQQSRRVNGQRTSRTLGSSASIRLPPSCGGRKSTMTQRRHLARFGGEVHASLMGAMGPVLRNLAFSAAYGATPVQRDGPTVSRTTCVVRHPMGARRQAAADRSGQAISSL